MRKERRSEPRWRVEYLATMVSDKGGPRYCVVTEMSEGGVRIKTIIYRVPDEFGLRLTGQAIAKRYSVVWRNSRHVGAKLIDAPHLSHGARGDI
jgi:PilZ domain